MKVYIAICDRNTKDQEIYQNLCHKIGEERGLDLDISLFSTEDALLFAIDEHHDRFNVIFIDIVDYGDAGIDTLIKIKKRYQDKEVIFLTRSKNKFREAFDIFAFNYIVKNEDSEQRFEDVLLRVVEKVKGNSEECIVFNSAGEHRCVPVRSIRYFELLSRRVIVYYDNEKFEFITTMNKLTTHLADFGFLRIHRAFLVSGIYIKSLSAKQAILKDGTEIPVGRVFYKQARDEFAKNFQNNVV